MGKVGHPVGSGEQLPSAARGRKSRSNLAVIGAVRVDFSLDPDSAAKHGQLIELWACPTARRPFNRPAISFTCPPMAKASARDNFMEQTYYDTTLCLLSDDVAVYEWQGKTMQQTRLAGTARLATEVGPIGVLVVNKLSGEAGAVLPDR